MNPSVADKAVYLDNAATTPLDPRVLDVMLPFMQGTYGNPASLHPVGRRARDAVELARCHVAESLGAEAREIVFTSGATEANNLAIRGAAFAAVGAGGGSKRILTFASEHKCVLESARSLEAHGFEVEILPVNEDGRPDLDAFAQALRRPTLLVSNMAANNETGVINDIRLNGQMAKRAGALFHTDSAQAYGKIRLDLADLDCVDLASISAHKAYGPQGVGALFVRRRPRARISPILHGGGQERGLRSGTLPVALIAGLGKAARLAKRDLDGDRMMALREWTDEFEQAYLSAYTSRGGGINGSDGPRLPGYVNVSLPEGAEAADMAARLGGMGVMVAYGSACTAATGAGSYVLRAMGRSEARSKRGLRISGGRFSSAQDFKTLRACLRDALGGIFG